MESYNPKNIEGKWQQKWAETKLYETDIATDKEKVYVLDMFPYPSGEGLHVGHPKGYIATDIYSRMKKMRGFEVLHPMGWDAFGLPAEQFALKNKVHPRVAVEKNIVRFKEQLSIIGFNYDWTKEINTTDPEFYKWTQWIFKQMWKKGLAYESNEPINWCPSCKTGLANEDLDGDVCERCGTKVEKKPLRQWVLKITDYADRMIADLDKLDWPEGVKLAQKNWIGRNEGVEFDFELSGGAGNPLSQKIFTTRPDTLCGATFVAISAELANTWIKNGWQASNEIISFVHSLNNEQSAIDYSAEKEKKGIDTGIKAINPITKEEMPVWVANYVIGGVGTGAIMAVPAHDERDYEFAKKYSLHIKQVVWKNGTPIKSFLMGSKNISDEELSSLGVVVSEKDNDGDRKILIPKESLATYETLISEKMENGFWNEYVSDGIVFIFKNKDGSIERIILSDDTEETVDKKAAEFCGETWNKTGVWKWLSDNEWYKDSIIHASYGTLINSGKYTGLPSEIAKEKIMEDCGGRKVIKYKLQDWVFARQRYWGEPFPIVFDEQHVPHVVADSELPVRLPEVEAYEPTGTGESPLAAISDWVNVTGYLDENGEFVSCNETDPRAQKFTRETNTMPQWAGSSWYYLRFADPHNNEALIDKNIEKKWQPVDVYVGGDHATRHLIYARFWHKFLYDIGAVSYDEPFSRLEFLGFILAEDGRKMSKRLGNVINPDDIVKQYGADALRIYEMFMAPFEQTVAWDTKSIVGVERFLERVWKLQTKVTAGMTDSTEVTSMLHKTIKKVGEDIESFKFNTAISAMMICLNKAETAEWISREWYAGFIRILAPFAPHIVEELRHAIGEESSIHEASWPTYDETFLQESTVTIAVQIGGKLRGTVVTERDTTEELVLEKLKETDYYKKYVGAETPKKVIFVPNKLINIVI